MKSFLLAAVCLGLSGCAFSPMRTDDPQAALDRQELQGIQAVRESGEAARSCSLTDEFIKKHPHSVYLFSARLQEGRCFEDAGRLNEAAEVYRDVREKSGNAEPGLPALAEWRLSFIAESQGDDLKALAHVLGAEQRLTDLPERLALVELPSRKAMLSFRLGHDEDGESSFRTAERGLRQILASPEPKPKDAWLSRLYLEMGRSQATAVDAENLTRFLKAQQVSQPYLLKTLRFTDESSLAALDLLKSNYTKYWNAVARLKIDPAAGAAVVPRLKREKQIPLLAELLKVLQEAQAVQPPADAMTTPEREFFGMAEAMSSSIRKVLYANAETMVLTEESRLLNGLRRGTTPPNM